MALPEAKTTVIIVKSDIEIQKPDVGVSLQKRLLIIIALVVIAAIILWPEDEESADPEQKSSNAMIAQPRQSERMPAQQPQTAPPGFSGQPSWQPDYAPRQGHQGAPAYPHSQGRTVPYNGYSFRYPDTAEPEMTPGRVPKFPGADPPQYPSTTPPAGAYGYDTVPGYRFRPQEDTRKSHRRYSGDYPSHGYQTPWTHPSQGLYQPGYGSAAVQPRQAPGYGTGQSYPGEFVWDQYPADQRSTRDYR